MKRIDTAGLTEIASPVDQVRVREDLDAQLVAMATATKNKELNEFMLFHSDGFRLTEIDGNIIDRDEYEKQQANAFSNSEIDDISLQIDQLAAGSNEVAALVNIKINGNALDSQGKWGKAGELVKTSITGKAYQRWKLIKGSWKLNSMEIVEQKFVVNGVIQPND